MKSSRVAAVVAGSVIAVGVGAPAFADTGNTTMPTSLDGGVNQVLKEQPLQKAVDDTQVGSTFQTVTKAAEQLKGGTGGTDALLGQATGAAKGVLPGLLGGLPVASLLGGLPLGG